VAPEPYSRLEGVTVAVGGGFIMPGKNTRFRIRIYDYDSIKNNPGVDLCDSVIEVYGRGIIRVKLDKYGIVLPHRQFFVAVQWLFIDENIEGP
jgi:hypothetical protein